MHGVEPKHLARLKLTKARELDAILGRAVLDAAGMAGSELNKETHAAAVRRLESQMEELVQLGTFLKQPFLHPGLRVAEHINRRQIERGGDPIRLRLAAAGDEQIVFRLRFGKPREELLLEKGKETRPLTQPDLLRHGLGDRTRFDAAVTEALANVAPEDLEE